MYPPVLQLIRELLVTHEEEPFDVDIERCLGYTEGRQPCKAWTKTDRKTAQLMSIKFAALEEVPHNDDFYDNVKQFIELVYCTPNKRWKTARPHAAETLARFDAWKQERTTAHLRPPETADSMGRDSRPVNTASGADAPVSQTGPQTPSKKPNGGKIDADEQDSIPGSPSNTGLSPGGESVFDFNEASPASTEVTTPGSIPFGDCAATAAAADDDFDFDGAVQRRKPRDEIQHYDDEYRPDTPTPLPRNGIRFAQIGPLGIVCIPRRPTTRHERHKKLLQLITSPFTKLDHKVGKVYVWKHKKEPLIIKVGFTTTTIKQRRRNGKKCYAKQTDEFWESPMAFVGASRVEQIVKQLLCECNICLRICNICSDGHTEWFGKDAEEARVLMQDWTKFVSIAYTDGRITEAACRAVTARVLDIRPDIPELSDSVDGLISVVAELESAICGTDDCNVVGAPDAHGGILVGEGQITVTAEPDSWSFVSLEPCSPDTVPRDGSAAIAEPKWRELDWIGKAKAARRLFRIHKLAQSEDSRSPSGSKESKQELDTTHGEEKKVTAPLKFWRKLHKKSGADIPEDEPRVRKRISSWIPKPRRAATFY